MVKSITKVEAQQMSPETLIAHTRLCRLHGIPTRIGHSEIEHYKPDPSRKKGWTNDHLTK